MSLELPPWPAAVSQSTVVHRRRTPAKHAFTATVDQVWIDPDQPGELFDHHRWWSHRRISPIRFRRKDYLAGTDTPLGTQVRDALEPVLGQRPTGPIRMLTQPRIWGWLFNPITVYLSWTDDSTYPTAALLEVTNTPWKERHLYPVPLRRQGHKLKAEFAKALHVSPFLDSNHVYHLEIEGSATPRVAKITLDVHPSASTSEADNEKMAILHTHVRCQLQEPTRAAMSLPLHQLSTHRVSFGIHQHALRLWRKGVPFVAHPNKQR